MTVGFVACPMLFMKIYYDFFDMITIMKCRLHVIEIKVVNLIEMPGGWALQRKKTYRND